MLDGRFQTPLKRLSHAPLTPLTLCAFLADDKAVLRAREKFFVGDMPARGCTGQPVSDPCYVGRKDRNYGGW